MYAIVDCNSFYCTCERLFRPDLWQKPVVVLSNNDGCIISRTDEARKVGVGMAVPYYQCREIMEKNEVAVFSSNYNLYGELSRRVMETLSILVNDSSCNRVEVYSVDEAFINLDHLPPSSVAAFAKTLKDTVEQWTGIRVSVGVAPTKVLSKVANRLSKKNKDSTNGVMVLDTDEKIREALESTDVGDIWGVGGRYGKKLRDQFGIVNAYQLKHVPVEWARKELGGVVGVRLIRELSGDPCIDMKDPLEKKKMIATTRMFGKAVYTLQPLKEAVATFVSRAAEKLRRQNSAAGTIDVFVVTNGSGDEKYSYNPKSDHRYFILPMASSQTDRLIAYAMPLIEKLFRPGMKYLKAGVILGGIVPEAEVQGNLFTDTKTPPAKGLMEVLDNLNFSMRGDVVRFGATGLTRNWKMRQELRSQRYTTRWEELFVVK